MRAEWRIKGIYKADAQKVADEIGDKKVTPQEILEKARDETSELHNLDIKALQKRLKTYLCFQVWMFLSRLITKICIIA